MNEETHCKTHGLELVRKSFDETKNTSWSMRLMFYFRSPSRFKSNGKERTFLVCPKGDYATE